MAGIVSRRPVVGVAAGIIIGALGWLLIGMDTASGMGRSIAGLLFTTAGYFFLFVAAMAFLNAFVSLWRTRFSRGRNDSPQG
jgi:proteasome assembly chaperone (PAC2) family protein